MRLFHKGVWQRAIAVVLVVGCVLLAWSLLTDTHESYARFGVGVQDLADARLWYPSGAAPSRVARLKSLLAGSAGDQGAALAGNSAPFPLLIYFGGWPGTEINNVELIEQLAQAGFVVVARLYPPSAERPMDFSSNSAYEDTLNRANSRVRRLAQDATALLDRLEALNRGEPASRFAGRLALSKVGIFGYSFGGAVAAQAAWGDPRIRAVVNIDGWSFGESAVEGIRQPYLFISDASAPPGPQDLVSTDPEHRYKSLLNQLDTRRLLHNLDRNGGLFVVLQGTEHSNFGDRGRRSRAREVLGLPADHAGRVQKLLCTYTEAFFRSALLGEDSPLMHGPSKDYPEARLRGPGQNNETF